MTEQRSDLIGQREVRIKKIKELRELGIDPYPSKTERTVHVDKINKDFEQHEGKNVIVAGRVMTRREHGPIMFMDLVDSTGKIQLYIKESSLGITDPASAKIGFDRMDLVDIGDILQAEGLVVKTQRGEISIEVTALKMLTKAVRPLPDKWAGIKDKELLFRKRYLDTIMNPEKKEIFATAAKIVFAIREFLYSRGFLEIKTPILQPIYGGGVAKPFRTRVNALNVDFYMAISHELYLKRLITAGFENVFNINGLFRNEGIDRTHNPEFQMLETMTAYQNYEYNMDLIEEMYKHIANTVFNRTVFMINGQEVDFGKPWERIMMIDAVKEYGGIDFYGVETVEEAHKILDSIGYQGEKPLTVGECMVKAFEEKVEEKLIAPTFVYGHPVEISPLAKRMSSNPKFVERFEVFIGGIEGGDNWTELNDPLELYERLKEQVKKGRAGSDEFHPMDVDFIEALEYGMPPTTGLGPGIERLIMMFTGQEYIDDILFFPILKPTQPSQTQIEIYKKEYLLDQGPSREEKEQDLSKKMAIVLVEDLAGWQLTNTVGHISAYLGNSIDKQRFASVDSFKTSDGTVLPSNSQYPIVTLKAKKSQMLKLMEEVEKSGLKYLVYVEDMITHNIDSDLSKALAEKSREEINYLGIGVFGERELVDKLTKKYSLLR